MIIIASWQNAAMKRIAALGVAERRVNAALQAMLAARQQREIVDKSCEKQKARHRPRTISRANKSFWMIWLAAASSPSCPGTQPRPYHDQIAYLQLDSPRLSARLFILLPPWLFGKRRSPPGCLPGLSRLPLRPYRSLLGIYQPGSRPARRRIEGGKESAGKKEQELNDLAMRLDAEQAEVNQATQVRASTAIGFRQECRARPGRGNRQSEKTGQGLCRHDARKRRQRFCGNGRHVHREKSWCS